MPATEPLPEVRSLKRDDASEGADVEDTPDYGDPRCCPWEDPSVERHGGNRDEECSPEEGRWCSEDESRTVEGVSRAAVS